MTASKDLQNIRILDQSFFLQKKINLAERFQSLRVHQIHAPLKVLDSHTRVLGARRVPEPWTWIPRADQRPRVRKTRLEIDSFLFPSLFFFFEMVSGLFPVQPPKHDGPNKYTRASGSTTNTE